MNGHVLDYLGAYLDGELNLHRRQRVEAHLKDCVICRSEFEGLQQVSHLLQTAPAPEFLPVEQFTARLALQLPRREFAEKPAKRLSLLWWLVPVVLLIAWFFIQTLLSVNGVISVMNQANLVEDTARFFSQSSSPSLWFSAVIDLFGSSLDGTQISALMFLDRLGALRADIFGQFIWQAAIALLYLTWLAVWWIRSGSRQIKMNGSRSLS
ncbi:MAG: anti-sigma factor family protein [Bellilinea sp.]